LGALNALHWDPDTRMYLDWGLHTEEVKLQRRTYSVSCQGLQQLVLDKHMRYLGCRA